MWLEFENSNSNAVYICTYIKLAKGVTRTVAESTDLN